MANPQDEEALVGPRVNHAEVPDPQLEQASELPRKRLAPAPLGRQDPLESVQGPDCLGTIERPQILRD